MWDPCRQEPIDSIEAVQRRAARFIKRDYNRTSSVTEMLKSLYLDRLEHKRKAHRLCIFYLAVNSLVVLPTPNHFYLDSVLLDPLLIIHLFNPVEIMIIIFIVFFQER